jgi:hypothetical protein
VSAGLELATTQAIGSASADHHFPGVRNGPGGQAAARAGSTQTLAVRREDRLRDCPDACHQSVMAVQGAVTRYVYPSRITHRSLHRDVTRALSQPLGQQV